MFFSGITESSPVTLLQGLSPYIKINLFFLVKLNLTLTCRLSLSECQPRKILTICSIHLPPSQDVHFSELEHFILQLPVPFVLIGDLSAHSPVWGDVRQDSRSLLVEKLLNYSIYLLNTGEPTYRHHSHQSFSVPDISICDSSLALVFDWLTHNDLCGGDHFPVILKTCLREDEPSAEHWKLNKADWMSFCSLCMSWLSDKSTLSEDPVAQFTDALTEIANKTISKSCVPKNKLPKVPWFDDTCKQTMKERNKAQ